MSTTIPTPTTTDLAPLDMGFGENEAVVKPTLRPHPPLVYMKGNLATTSNERAVGWHILAGVNPQLDELLMTRGVKKYTVEHETGDDPLKPYWNLSASGQPISLFVIASGLKSKWEMSKHMDERTGIAFGVAIDKEKDGVTEVINPETGLPKKSLHLSARVYIHELLNYEHPEEGFNEWFELSLRNYIIDDFLAALDKQFTVIDAYNAMMRAKGSKNRAPFWSFSIPLAIGSKKEVGKTDKKRSPIFPMVAVIPELTAENIQAAVAYLNAHRIPLLLQEIVRESLLGETVVWSVEHSREIVEGKRDLIASTVVTEEAVDGHVVEMPQLPPAGDPLVTEEQEHWIRDTYCGGEESVVRTICDFYKVTELTQLHKSHYNALYKQLNG